MPLEQPFSKRNRYSTAKEISVREDAPGNLRYFVLQTAVDVSGGGRWYHSGGPAGTTTPTVGGGRARTTGAARDSRRISGRFCLTQHQNSGIIGAPSAIRNDSKDVVQLP